MINGHIIYRSTIHISSLKVSTFFRILLCFLQFISIDCNVYGQNLVSDENLFQVRLKDYIEGCQQKADSLIKLNKIEQAEKCYDLAYHKAKESQNDSLYITVGNDYTRFLYGKVNKIHKAIEVSRAVQKFCKQINNKNGLIQAYSRNAYALLLKGGSEKEALEFYNKAIVLMDKNTASTVKMPIFVNKGRIFSSVGLMKIARINFHLALSSYLKTDNINFKIYILGEIRSTFGEKQLDSASYYDRILLDYDNKLNLKEGDKTLIYNNAAYTYILQNKPEKAKKLIEEKVYVNTSYTQTFNNNPARLHTIGAMHMKLGEYTTAIQKFETAKQLAIDRKRRSVILPVLQDLSKCYERIGNLESSLKTTRIIKAVMDSLNTQNIQKEVAKLEIRRKLKEKEKEITALQQEKATIYWRISKIQLVSYLFGSILFIGGLGFFNRMSVNKAKIHQLNEKVNHNQLLSLQSAMNPHFLLNTFSTLQSFILKKEIKKANSYMTTLSEFIRNVFARSNGIYTHFADEIKILKSYIELELVRLNHNFEVGFEVPKKLSDDNPMIPSMILQPYLENAISHGLSAKRGTKRLTIRFTSVSSKKIRCEITDNGIGRKKVEEIQKKSKTTTKKNLSIATSNTEERLRIIDKKDEKEGNIVIHDLYDVDGKAKGTQVTISLPIIKNDN